MLPKPMSVPATEQNRGSYLARHWYGKLSLAKSFWFNALVFGIIIFYSLLFVNITLFGLFRDEPDLAVVLIVSSSFIGICSLVWALVGLWRSAYFYMGRRTWSVLARLVTVVWLGWIGLYWFGFLQTLITTYFDCTLGRDLGKLAPLFTTGPCEVAWYPKHGLVVRRFRRSSLVGGGLGPVEDPFK
jgi:hypothetical protein